MLLTGRYYNFVEILGIYVAEKIGIYIILVRGVRGGRSPPWVTILGAESQSFFVKKKGTLVVFYLCFCENVT